MKLDKNIRKELEEIAPVLARLDKTNFYEVEEGYFENSAGMIMESVERHTEALEEFSPVLSLLQKKELYQAPGHAYFESFSDKMITEIHAEDVDEELSYALPVLQHVAKKELYEVPAAYFNTFPAAITKLASKEVKEHPSTIAQWSSRWSEVTERVLGLIARPRYAFAMASVVSLVVCIVLVIKAETLSDEDKIFSQMQQLSDTDLHHYLGKHRDDFDEHTILHNLNNVDFIHYKNDKPGQVRSVDEHTNDISNEEITNEDIVD